MKKTKSKSSLFLIELAFAIFIFSISAAICMQVFAAAKRTSLRSDELGYAAIWVQSAAETYKAAGGDLDSMARILGGRFNGQDEVTVSFNSEWQADVGTPCYELSLTHLGGGEAYAHVYKVETGELVYGLEIRIPGGGEG